MTLPPFKSEPKPPAAYKGAPKLLFQKGAGKGGLILVVKYNDASDLKAYSEVVFIPGLYKPLACMAAPELSVARIWVNSNGTRRAGRCIWGLSKELAYFDWAEGAGWKSVTMKDPSTGKTTFFANVSDAGPIPSLDLLPYPPNISAIQWPIRGTESGPCAADEPAYAVNNEALKSKPISPIRTLLSINFEGGSVLSFNPGTYVDPKAFTGKGGKPLVPDFIAVRMPDGGASLLSKPEIFKC